MNSNNNMSLYIPYVRLDVEKEFMADLFGYLDIGCVSRIDFVTKTNKYGNRYHRAYIHFERWYETIVSYNFQEKVKEKTARLVYNDPYYWVVLENPIKINKGDTITVMPSSHLEEEISKLKNEVDIQKRLYTNLVQENNTMAIKIQMLDSLKKVAEECCLESIDQMEELVYKLEEKNKICDFLRETNGKLIENNICLMNELNYLKEIKHLPTST
uniref:Uncharacterized protein n=1 Tax=viral metagenome TaxID=1070528 RepID=A0A6C0E1Z3_9ZZZZ